MGERISPASPTETKGTRIRKTQQCLPELVSEETMSQAGFNYYENSRIFNKDSVFYGIHLSYPQSPECDDLNIILIDERRSKAKRSYHKWYLHTFRGPEISQESEEKFWSEIAETIEHYEIEGTVLEKKLQEIIDQLYS